MKLIVTSRLSEALRGDTEFALDEIEQVRSEAGIDSMESSDPSFNAQYRASYYDIDQFAEIVNAKMPRVGFNCTIAIEDHSVEVDDSLNVDLE